MNEPVQINLFDYLESLQGKDDPVEITGVINLKSRPISHYEVSLPYGDLVLIVAMLRDYVRGLDEVKRDDIQWHAYYRNRFLGMADRISQQIEYDYDKAMQKCLKKQAKESDIGEDALILALKKGSATQKNEGVDPSEKEEKDENNGGL
ncbi:MAG: hypothetical protein K6G83_15910 [Lachnospiraceae bacterium]|nr:hypothetical protein [Lachnospiraceae bacterium]